MYICTKWLKKKNLILQWRCSCHFFFTLSLLPSPNFLLSTFPWTLLASSQILRGCIRDTGFYPASKQQLWVDFIFQMVFSSHPSNSFIRYTRRILKFWDVGPRVYGQQDLWAEHSQHNHSAHSQVTNRQQLRDSHVHCTEKFNNVMISEEREKERYTLNRCCFSHI